MKFKLLHILEPKQAQDNLEAVIQQCYPSPQVAFVHATINHAYFNCQLVVYNNQLPVGCLCLYKNPLLVYKQQAAWCIGNFECINNSEAAQTLLVEANRILQTNRAEFVIGPMNGSTWDDYRIPQENSKALFFTEAPKQSYYNSFFKAAGFSKIGAYFSSIDQTMVYGQTEVVQRKEELLKNGITFRNINLAQFSQELELLYPFITEAFKTNFLYTPIEKSRFIEKYKLVERFIDPTFVLIAEDRHKNIVGFFFSIPDHFNAQEKGLVIKTIARQNNPHYKGLGHVMAELIYENACNKGFTYVVHAFMHKSGTSVDISKNYSGELYKEYTLYGKEI